MMPNVLGHIGVVLILIFVLIVYPHFTYLSGSLMRVALGDGARFPVNDHISF